MKVFPTEIPGPLVIEPQVFHDPRGFFVETWNAERYAAHGIPPLSVQDNLSVSARGVLRGLHYQWPEPQAKLVYVIEGEVFDVAVDIRRDSPTFGRWVGATLSAANMRQLFLPEGFAHGFCVISERVVLAYKCSRPYHAQFDAGIAWNDPQIGVQWPLAEPLLSEKDRRAPRLAELSADRLPS